MKKRSFVPIDPNVQQTVQFSKQRAEAELIIPAGKRDLEALRSVTRDWLVPRLVEEFLRERGIEPRSRANAVREKTPISNT